MRGERLRDAHAFARDERHRARVVDPADPNARERREDPRVGRGVGEPLFEIVQRGARVIGEDPRLDRAERRFGVAGTLRGGPFRSTRALRSRDPASGARFQGASSRPTKSRPARARSREPATTRGDARVVRALLLRSRRASQLAESDSPSASCSASTPYKHVQIRMLRIDRERAREHVTRFVDAASSAGSRNVCSVAARRRRASRLAPARASGRPTRARSRAPRRRDRPRVRARARETCAATGRRARARRAASSSRRLRSVLAACARTLGTLP
jgi:hypothetical protein